MSDRPHDDVLTGGRTLCDCGCLRPAAVTIARTGLVFSDKCGPPWDRIALVGYDEPDRPPVNLATPGTCLIAALDDGRLVNVKHEPRGGVCFRCGAREGQ